MLKNWWKSLEENLNEYQIGHKRGLVVRAKMKETFPDNITGLMSIDVDSKDFLRVFIYPEEKEFTESETVDIIHWLAIIGSEDPERGIRDSGAIYWTCYNREMKDDDKEYQVLFLVENAHAQNCTITKKRKMRTTYELECK